MNHRRIVSIGFIAKTLLLLTFPSTCQAAFPTVTYHQPLGVTRGEEATIKVVGAQLGDARQVLFDVPGVEVIEVKPIDEKTAELKVKTAKDLATGRYPFRVVTESGIANLRFLSVGAMPIVTEAEPNNDFATPQVVEMDRTIEGNIDREDVDYYQISLKAGQKLTVEIEGTRHRSDLRNRDTFDPYIAIINEKRFEVAVSDDSFLFQQDGVCSFTPEEAGNYVVMVRDSSFGGQKTTAVTCFMSDRSHGPPRSFPRVESREMF